MILGLYAYDAGRCRCYQNAWRSASEIAFPVVPLASNHLNYVASKLASRVGGAGHGCRLRDRCPPATTIDHLILASIAAPSPSFRSGCHPSTPCRSERPLCCIRSSYGRTTFLDSTRSRCRAVPSIRRGRRCSSFPRSSSGACSSTRPGPASRLQFARGLAGQHPLRTRVNRKLEGVRIVWLLRSVHDGITSSIACPISAGPKVIFRRPTADGLGSSGV